MLRTTRLPRTTRPSRLAGHPLDAIEARVRRARRWTQRASGVLGVGGIAAGPA